MKELISSALGELRKAAESMTEELSPHVPLPRVRTFEFAPGIVWPGESPGEGNQGWYKYARVNGYQVSLGDVAEKITKKTGGQPRKVLRALRRIEAATEWCRRRAEGRRRAAQEILRQQSRAVAALEAEEVIRGLK